MERDDDITLLLAKVHLIKERAKKENITITTQDAIEFGLRIQLCLQPSRRGAEGV